ncbi:FAD-binding domain-containing protein [Aspergillus affinis]|uniref:FAD-binding domain-containing protein n=1 Tax=Aspergillus affinis TaxID=1070780 RepID=UPI0022FEEF3A|nr:FAD-binding domain-containing protein [Aspergillus affinis]KAI9041091.1 FAD-binding domain-containing protein [Aspergillus affinis]
MLRRRLAVPRNEHSHQVGPGPQSWVSPILLQLAVSTIATIRDRRKFIELRLLCHVGMKYVYAYLDKFGLAAAGGRLGPVGVPGSILAGGVNFYGNQVGFACDTVVNYVVVLADGTVAQANKTSNPDLFWALKGGSSNFDECAYRRGEAAATYAANISDPKTHIVPALVPGETLMASVILFYDSEEVRYPDIFKPFTDIPSINSTVGFKTLSEFAAETGEMVVPHINDVLVAATDYKSLLEGITIINSTFFNELPKLLAQVPTANISTIQLDWHPIGADWMRASESRGGNALGLDPSKIYLCYAEVVEWIGSVYDDIVTEWVQDTTFAINNATMKAGLYDPFNYMGDSAGFQNIFEGYGEENHAKLQEIATRYDSEGVFQRLMPGGFKVKTCKNKRYDDTIYTDIDS